MVPPQSRGEIGSSSAAATELASAPPPPIVLEAAPRRRRLASFRSASPTIAPSKSRAPALPAADKPARNCASPRAPPTLVLLRAKWCRRRCVARSALPRACHARPFLAANHTRATLHRSPPAPARAATVRRRPWRHASRLATAFREMSRRIPARPQASPASRRPNPARSAHYFPARSRTNRRRPSWDSH